MKKIILAVVLMAVAGSTMACPRGQHPHGGVGSHHRGGYCSYEQ